MQSDEKARKILTRVSDDRVSILDTRETNLAARILPLLA